MNLRIPEQNKVFLVGRLTRDPDLRFTAKGQPICRLDLAVNRRYKDGNGEWQEEAAFVPVVVFWREMAERCGERLKKASPIQVEGWLRTRKWETKEGEPRSTLEVIAQRIQFLSKDDLSKDDLSRSADSADTEVTAESQGSPPKPAVDNEDVPF